VSALLEKAVLQEASKLVVRHLSYATHLAETARRIHTRGLIKPLIVRTPSYWGVDPGFHPFHVRSSAYKISFAIGKALRRHRYQPRPAVSYTVPKTDGTAREISVFQVADNAISRLVYKNLLVKNARQFSAYCYAYREDLTAHDAVGYLANEFRSQPRLFVAEFDFRKYFDSIAHSHLRTLLSDRRFYITKRERAIIDAFITAPTAPESSYPLGGVERTRGIPQGTSLSLFLANLAGYPLDKRLERLGVGFARYADDTVIWSTSYSRICQAVDALNEASVEMGVELNLSKSEGISILSNHANVSEFRTKPTLDFLGYSLGSDSVGIRVKTISRAKERLAHIIYTNLLEGPESGVLPPGRLSGINDRDYVVMIYQMRRFLYGDLTERSLAKYLSRAVPVMHYRGFMSYYPLVDRDDQLRQLDGWLLHTVWTSLRRRRQLIVQLGLTPPPVPFSYNWKGFVHLQSQTAAGHSLDLTVPSFFRIARMFRKAIRQFGPNAVAHPQSGQYYIA
jgi:RNA-directed DNA polymerase